MNIDTPHEKINKLYDWIFREGLCLDSMKEMACTVCLRQALQDAYRSGYETGWKDKQDRYEKHEQVHLSNKCGEAKQ